MSFSSIVLLPVGNLDFAKMIADDYATAKIDYDEFDRRIDDYLAHEDDPNWFPAWLVGGAPPPDTSRPETR